MRTRLTTETLKVGHLGKSYFCPIGTLKIYDRYTSARGRARAREREKERGREREREREREKEEKSHFT